jgi:hypothetical protein
LQKVDLPSPGNGDVTSTLTLSFPGSVKSRNRLAQTVRSSCMKKE